MQRGHVMNDMENTDPGSQRCATCGRKIQEVSVMTADGRVVCSRKCAVHGVTLPCGTPDEPTVNLRSPGSRAFSGARSFAWEPGAWLFGVRCDSHFVHLYVPMFRLSLGRSGLVHRMQRPHVWLPFCLLSVLALGVWLGTHWRSEPATSVSVYGPSAQRDERGASLATSASAPLVLPLAVSSVAPLAASSLSAVPLESAPAPSSSAVQAAASVPRAATSASAPRATASTKSGPDCAYPFIVDAKGVKHPKLECFDSAKDRF